VLLALPKDSKCDSSPIPAPPSTNEDPRISHNAQNSFKGQATDLDKKQTNIKTHQQSLEQTDFVQIEKFPALPTFQISTPPSTNEDPQISHGTPNSFKG